MMKKVIITVVSIVSLLAVGAAAMLLCVRGKETVETETEVVSLVEENIEVIEDSTNGLIDEVTEMYIEAAKDIFGDDYDDSKAVCNNEGLTYEGRFVSWEYLEEVAYNSMTNDWN